MRTAAAVFLACAFGVVAAAALPNFCPEVDYLGSWKEIDVGNDAEVSRLSQFLDLAVDTYIANNNVTLACPTAYQTELLAGCSQVVAGTNYKLLFLAECPSSGEYPLPLLADISVPVPALAAAGEQPEVYVEVADEAAA